MNNTNNLGKTLRLNIEVQNLYKEVPDALKKHVVRMVLTDLGLVGNSDTILSVATPLTWSKSYDDFIKNPTSFNFNTLIENIVNDEYRYANVTYGNYHKKQQFYQKFIDTMNDMIPKNTHTNVTHERPNTVSSSASTSTTPLLTKKYLSSASSSSIKGGWFSGGAGGRRRRGTKRARRTRRRSSRKN